MTGAGPLGAVGMGLTAAALWGGSDFAGGLGARRAPALLVVAAGHLVTFCLLILLCAGASLPGRAAVAMGLLAGIEGALSLALFYHALSAGAMGVTAALTGVLTAAVPVLFALLRQGWPRWTEWGGLAAGVAAIALVAWTRASGTTQRALLFGALAGVGFGVQLVLLKLAADGGVLWAMTTARAGGLVGVALALGVQWFRQDGGLQAGSSWLVWGGYWRMGIAAGVMDALGNGAYMLAAKTGRMEVGAMIASLYPVMTIALAALVLRERPTARQKMGMALAAAAILLLSL